jgi:hypothetical protein
MRSPEQQYIADCAEFLADDKITIQIGRDNPDDDFACFHFYMTTNGNNYQIGYYPFVNYIRDENFVPQPLDDFEQYDSGWDF